MPPLGSQADATQLGESESREWIFKLVLAPVNSRCGTNQQTSMPVGSWLLVLPLKEECEDFRQKPFLIWAKNGRGKPEKYNGGIKFASEYR
jgi:hypothetical protein